MSASLVFLADDRGQQRRALGLGQLAARAAGTA
jgi:hypothetical protein